MAEKVVSTNKEQINKSILDIVKIEDESAIVLVQGWRMRAYFSDKANKEKYSVGQSVEMQHYGDIDKPHEVRFLTLN